MRSSAICVTLPAAESANHQHPFLATLVRWTEIVNHYCGHALDCQYGLGPHTADVTSREFDLAGPTPTPGSARVRSRPRSAPAKVSARAGGGGGPAPPTHHARRPRARGATRKQTGQ